MRIDNLEFYEWRKKNAENAIVIVIVIVIASVYPFDYENLSNQLSV
jgi:hypothetical protein